MADEAKPVVTSASVAAAPTPSAPPAPAPAQPPPENKRDTSGDQMVTVKAIARFHKGGDPMKGDEVNPDSPPFEVTRLRAAQLRANSLIEYVDPKVGVEIHGAASEALDKKAAQRAALSEIPENSRGKPLINPEIKMAKAKDAQ